MAEGPNKDSDKKIPWKEAAKELQQFYYEVFGDRDWDFYEECEMEYLERNVGHAVFGPPKELPDEKNGCTGYAEKELNQIRKICDTIKKHGKYSPKCSDSGVFVSTIYVCLNIKEESIPIPIFRIPNYDPKKELKACPDQFVDSSCRVYKHWKDFLKNNQLPKCTYCYPRGGVYDGDDNDQLYLEFGETPASRPGSVICSALDTASTVVMVGGLGVGVTAVFTTVAAPLLLASSVGAVLTGVYGAGRNVAVLVDRDQHQQSINVTDAEARTCWLSFAGNLLGVASAQAVKVLTKVTQSGQVVGKAGRLAVNVLNFGSLTVNGIGLVNNFASLCEKYHSEELTPLDVFQFASSCLFFTMSAVNIKTAGSIVRETQNQVLSDFEASLRSNRHRRAFRRVANQTRGEDGNTVQGNAKVIRGIAQISDKDDFFAGLVRVQKQYAKSGAKVTLTEQGLVKINGHLEVHPMEFSVINKVQRQVILDATKNIRTGTWTTEQFNQEIHNFCQEHNIAFRSQRAETVESIEAIGSEGDSVLSKLNDQQIDTVTFCMRKFAKEHYQTFLSIAIKLSDILGFKRTAEVLCVVQFVANYVEQVGDEMERRYQEDLQNAQSSQGQNFNREQFDNEYQVQGKSTKNFVGSVLENYNTIQMIHVLKEAYQRMFPSEANPSDTEGNAEDHNSHTSPHTESDSSSDNMASSDNTADASSVTNVCSIDETTGADQEADVLYKERGDFNRHGDLSDNEISSVTTVCSIDKTAGADQEAAVLYKENRDFNKYGDLSDNEIYDIVREVTELYLFEGNSKLSRLGEATYVSVTDPHIEPVTIIVFSDRHNQSVTAGLIV